MPYEVIETVDPDDIIAMDEVAPLTAKLNEVIEFINNRRDIPGRAVAVEELAIMQAQTTVRWLKKHGRTKPAIRELLEL